MRAIVFVLDVAEFRSMVIAAREMAGVAIGEPNHGYLRISAPDFLEFNRKALGFKPAVWYGALTGGIVGSIAEYSRDTIRIEAICQLP